MRINLMAKNVSYQSAATYQGVTASDGAVTDHGIGFFNQTRLRHSLLIFVLFSLFSLIAGNLVSLAVLRPSEIKMHLASPIGVQKSRPDIVDAEGRLLATDIEAPSLYANPSGLMEPALVVKKLKKAMPELDEMNLLRQLTKKNKQFVFIKRGMHPKRAQEIFDLGLPGVDVTPEIRRVYPKGALGGYVLGHVDIDNVGRAGIEKFIDKARSADVNLFGANEFNTNENGQVQLSLNVGANYILQQELNRALKLYKAKSAAGVVMNVHSGEVVALSSLPDLDPQRPFLQKDKARFDRISAGLFELGSVFKTVTMAMALEANKTTLDTKLDVTGPLKIGAHKINDYHGVKGELSVRDIFVRSSNIGTAKLALLMGTKAHRDFLNKLHLLEPMKTELGAMRSPQTVKRWGDVHSATISYGHGLSIAPLQFVSAVGALVNGGIYVKPTFLKRSEREAKLTGERVISVSTSEKIRKLLRANVTDRHGTARRAEVAPYRVGGKTGTANKVVKGKYSKTKVLTSFVGVFPSERPEYVVFVMLDEPQATKAAQGLTVAGMNAAPTTGRIISRLAPLFKMKPFYPVLNRVSLEK
ncbi:penicillin-binding protein 2 [Hyphomicrobiales bacterium 4NK60-0047b]